MNTQPQHEHNTTHTASRQDRLSRTETDASLPTSRPLPVRALPHSNREKNAEHITKLIAIIGCDAIVESKTGIYMQQKAI